MSQDLLITRGKVLRPHGLDAEPVHVSGGLVAAKAGAEARTIDASGLLVLPGLVDIHGDAFERQIMPRPGVQFDLGMALADTDRQLVANGITTALHGITWSWEPGLRGPQTSRAIVAAIADLRPRFAADTHVHLRHETYNLDAEVEIAGWIAEGRIRVLAFNDHMSGTIKDRARPDKIEGMAKRAGLSAADFAALVEATYARRAEVPQSIERLAAACRNAGLPMLSHDDMSPAQRHWYRELGARVAEFPINAETAASAAAAGDDIVFGAPNVVRGGSHTGCPSAADMVGRGHCSILASDYYYPALVAAPFQLVRDRGVELAQAWSLVSRNPARAAGFSDRGELAPGQRADVVLVDGSQAPGALRVVMTIVGGRIVHCADAALLS